VGRMLGQPGFYHRGSAIAGRIAPGCRRASRVDAPTRRSLMLALSGRLLSVMSAFAGNVLQNYFHDPNEQY
jgi:hypothetical protein